MSLIKEKLIRDNSLMISVGAQFNEKKSSAILEWFKKKRSRYFSKKGTYLVGCEIPIVIAPNKMLNNPF